MSNFISGVRDQYRRGAFRTTGVNALYGVVDYLAQALAMLAAAAFLVHKLGLSHYGLWMLATAVVGGMESLSSGFGDATIRFVSKYRGRGDRQGVERIIRATVTINGLLGLIFAAAVILSAPYAVSHVFRIEAQDRLLSIHVLQVAGVTLFLRSLDNVFGNALRAYEKYSRTVRISVAVRYLNVAAVVLLVMYGKGVLAMMIATFVTSMLSLILQATSLRSVCGPVSLLPTTDSNSIREIFSFGVFSWLQALASVIFNNADRLVVGALVGTSALGIYSVCVQASQPIHAFTSAALNFIFPHVSARSETEGRDTLRHISRLSTLLNLAIVVVLATPLVLFSRQILTIWMGAGFAEKAHAVLVWLVVANAALGACVASHYVLLAIGEVRFVALTNLLGGALSLCCIALLMPYFGLIGAAIGRIVYAAAAALNFWKLHEVFSESPVALKSSYKNVSF